jgi:hypothetical protein
MMEAPPIPTETTHASPSKTINTACIQTKVLHFLSEPVIPFVAPSNFLLKPDSLPL